MSRLTRISSADRPITLRATADERARWERCAALVKLDLSALIRRSIERQCKMIEARVGRKR